MKLYVKKRISFTKLVETNLHYTPAKNTKILSSRRAYLPPISCCLKYLKNYKIIVINT